MGYLKYVRNLWKKPSETLKEVNRERLIKWRKEPVTSRVKKPTRIDRARSLGYKAKQGYIIIRQRVAKSASKNPQIKHGRRPKHNSSKKILDMNYRLIAEQKAERTYVNCTALNSYLVGSDGKHEWYEVILVDRTHPQILADQKINWICDKKNRAARGLTSAARKSRGLRHKGKGAEKLRPSRTANKKRRRPEIYQKRPNV